MGKEETAPIEQFLLFPQCFPTCVENFLPFSSNLKLSSSAFSLDKSKNFCLGKDEITSLLSISILSCLFFFSTDRCPLADKQSVQHIHNVIFECLLYEIEENYVDIDEHVSGIFDLLNFMIDVAPDSILLHRMFEQHGSYASSQLISEFIDPCSMKTL